MGLFRFVFICNFGFWVVLVSEFCLVFGLLQLIESLIDRVDLSEAEAEASLDFLLKDASEALISAFLVLLRAKGETYEEVKSSLLLGSIRMTFIIYISKL